MISNNELRVASDVSIDVLHNEVATAFRQLTPKQEKAIRLYYGIGCERRYEVSEIAEEFGVSIRRIRKLLVEGSRLFEESTIAQLHRLGRRRQGAQARPLATFEANREQIEIQSVIMRLIDEAISRKAISREALLRLNPRQFEEFIAEMWNKLGYKVELTRRTRDGGRDIVAVRKAEAEVRYLIECKRYDLEHKVGVQFVRALYGVKMHDNATKAFLATTSSFTKDALDFFEDHRWELEPRDYDGIAEWLKRITTLAQRPTRDDIN